MPHRLRTLVALAVIWTAGAAALDDDGIRAEAGRLETLAARDSPRLAVPALLRAAAVVDAYAPAERRRLLELAASLARANAGVRLSHRDVWAWMQLDPTGGEALLRTLPDQGAALDALAAFRRTPALAAEAIRADLQGALAREFSWRLLATHRPREAVKLFGEAVEAAAAAGRRSRVMEAARALVGGLAAAETQAPLERAAALAQFREMQTRLAAAASADFTMTLPYKRAGREVATNSNAETLAAWSELLAGPAAALAEAQTDFRWPSAADPPPVNADVPLEEALRQIRTGNLFPPSTQVGALWLYLIGKPRTEVEARPIVAALIQMAEQSGDAARDPFWHLQSLLNLDGRGPRWKLPAPLRPLVFAAAARLGHRAKDASQLQEFAEAMVAQGVEAPPAEGAVSALLQYRIAHLAAALETRFDFTLPRVGDAGRTVRLSSLRGKTVMLNFWRHPMPLPAEPHSDSSTVLLWITDQHPAAAPPPAAVVLFDRDRRVFNHYRVMVPHTVTLDAGGRIKPATRP